MRRSSRFSLTTTACAALCASALFCAGGYRLISLSDLEYKTCRLSNPDAGIAVSVSKQPLYETGNRAAYEASIRRKTGVFAVRIENKGLFPLYIDSGHVRVLDGSGNPAAVVKNVQEASKAFGAGRSFGYDIAANPLLGKTLYPGESYDAFICVSTPGDPYFATYYLRFAGKDGETLTEARF
jgi:hypothetical protein